MSTQNSQLISGGLIVTMNDERDVFFGDLRIEQGKITAIASQLKPRPGEIVTSARGNFILPGLIQCHTHVCQSLFRGLADDLSLLDWLTKKIWPFEAAHNSSSMKASTQYALVEMQLLGTTSILDMGSTRHGHSIFETAHHLGMRFWGGNCWADLKERSGPIYLDTAST
ncbi:MAG: amidohydrolase family protein, partial [Bdellovibrionales bacterium]|nr:amidohydrolase family protein [Bdellovibrionales bacterium]